MKIFFRTVSLWYGVIVQPGTEHDIKRKMMNHKPLEIEDLIISNYDSKHIYELIRHQNFAGYIFFKTILNHDKYSTILRMDNVHRFLGNIYTHSKVKYVIPIHIEEDDIKSVKKYLNGKNESMANFKVDHCVEIQNGDLAGVKGKIVEVGDQYVKMVPEVSFQNVIQVDFDKLTMCV